MHLSRIVIENFRNFSKLDVTLNGNVVLVGENKVGKSNLMHALRLLFDPSLPDSARELGLADFWDGLGGPKEDDKIVIGVEIEEFETDLDILALLTDFRLDDPDTVRLTYECRARPGLGRALTSENDLEFICFGGKSETKRFGHDLRRRLTMDLLPALRDAEGVQGDHWAIIERSLKQHFALPSYGGHMIFKSGTSAAMSLPASTFFSDHSCATVCPINCKFLHCPHYRTNKRA